MRPVKYDTGWRRLNAVLCAISDGVVILTHVSVVAAVGLIVWRWL